MSYQRSASLSQPSENPTVYNIGPPTTLGEIPTSQPLSSPSPFSKTPERNYSSQVVKNNNLSPERQQQSYVEKRRHPESKINLIKILYIALIILAVVIAIGFLIWIFMYYKRRRFLTIPPPPVSLTATVLSISSFNVSWNTVVKPFDIGSVKYLIYRNEGSSVSTTVFTEKVMSNDNNYIFNNVTPGSTQSVMVLTIFRTWETDVISSPSASVTIELCINPPLQPTTLDIIIPITPATTPFQIIFLRPTDNSLDFTGKLVFVDTTSVNPIYVSPTQTSFTCDPTICTMLINDPTVNLTHYNKVYSNLYSSNHCGISPPSVISELI